MSEVVGAPSSFALAGALTSFRAAAGWGVDFPGFGGLGRSTRDRYMQQARPIVHPAFIPGWRGGIPGQFGVPSGYNVGGGIGGTQGFQSGDHPSAAKVPVPTPTAGDGPGGAVQGAPSVGPASAARGHPASRQAGTSAPAAAFTAEQGGVPAGVGWNDVSGGGIPHPGSGAHPADLPMLPVTDQHRAVDPNSMAGLAAGALGEMEAGIAGGTGPEMNWVQPPPPQPPPPPMGTTAPTPPHPAHKGGGEMPMGWQLAHAGAWATAGGIAGAIIGSAFPGVGTAALGFGGMAVGAFLYHLTGQDEWDKREWRRQHGGDGAAARHVAGGQAIDTQRAIHDVDWGALHRIQDQQIRSDPGFVEATHRADQRNAMLDQWRQRAANERAQMARHQHELDTAIAPPHQMWPTAGAISGYTPFWRRDAEGGYHDIGALPAHYDQAQNVGWQQSVLAQARARMGGAYFGVGAVADAASTPPQPHHHLTHPAQAGGVYGTPTGHAGPAAAAGPGIRIYGKADVTVRLPSGGIIGQASMDISQQNRAGTTTQNKGPTGNQADQQQNYQLANIGASRQAQNQ